MDEQKKDPESNAEAAVVAGKVFVTFDASGGLSQVDSNPSQALKVTEEQGTVAWHLVKTLNVAPGWAARICNVVLCDPRDIPDDFQSWGSPDGQVWTWTWTLSTNGTQRTVPYDLFICYGPASSFGEPMPSSPLVQVVSLREILATDPSILLPPEPNQPLGS